MDFSCPDCGRSLKQHPPVSVPLPGQRRLLAWRTGLSCPACGCRVQIHLHPMERRVRQFDVYQLLLLIVLSVIAEDVRYFWASTLLSGFTEIGLWLWSRRSQTSWKRYVVTQGAS